MVEGAGPASATEPEEDATWLSPETLRQAALRALAFGLLIGLENLLGIWLLELLVGWDRGGVLRAALYGALRGVILAGLLALLDRRAEALGWRAWPTGIAAGLLALVGLLTAIMTWRYASGVLQGQTPVESLARTWSLAHEGWDLRELLLLPCNALPYGVFLAQRRRGASLRGQVAWLLGVGGLIHLLNVVDWAALLRGHEFLFWHQGFTAWMVCFGGLYFALLPIAWRIADAVHERRTAQAEHPI